ncbi:MAG: tetratricopeptide repeat protein [Candidatus Poribacteria bacterium]|nr:tetratricopeptide repeat protein [Candidatus Poribacteria bacterium]
MEDKNNITAKTINEFIEWAAQFSDGQYLFRGVSTESYKIEASAYRRLPEIDRNDPKKLLKINKDLIMKAKALGHDEKNGQQLSDLEILAELQHFGAATCLIDFSRSALVALWFACQQGSRGGANGKVYAVRHDDMVRLKTVNPDLITKDIDYFLEPDESGRYPLYQWQPKLQNNRIIAQQSVFVFSGAQIEAEAECIIDKNSKQDILTSLDKISGVTEASIYPDFDGFARLHAHNKSYIEPDAQDYLRRGIEADQNDNPDDAIEYYTEVIRLDPPDAFIVSIAHSNRGVAYSKKGETERAIEDYDQTIRLNPESAAAYNNRGYAYRQKGEFKRAIEDYDRAIQIRSDNVLFYNNRAIALLHLQEWEKAKSDLTIARNMGVDIIALFRSSFSSIADFEEKYSIEVPEDIATLLTSS